MRPARHLPRMLLAGLCWLAAAAAAAEARATYSFGVLPQRSALLTARYWNPILEYVSRRSGIELLLVAARSTAESAAATEKGEYDFIYSNIIFQPVMARAAYRVILRPLDEAITGQIVTLADSPIHALADMAGREMGFPSRVAFVGYTVPMDHLLRQGIRVTPVFGANQEGIMTQLKAGTVLAAAVNSEIMRDFASRERLRYRVLWQSARFLNIPIAAHPRIPAALAARVGQALAQMDAQPEGRRILAASAQIIGKQPPHGFRAASPADYRANSDFYRASVARE